MQYAISFDARPPLLTMTVRGPIDLDICRSLLTDLAGRFAAHQYPPILVDTREATPELSATEIYQLAEELAEAGFGKRSRFAVVTVPRADFDRAGFLEQIAGHRGLDIHAFLDRDAALSWLRS
jgi:hypothetical protein